MFARFATVFVALAAVAQAAEWELDNRPQATIMVGLGATNQKDATIAVATGQNGGGEFVSNYDTAGDAWSKSENLEALLLMDAAVTRSGTTLVTGMGALVKKSNENYYSKVDGLLGVSQAAYSFGSDGETLGMVGSFDLVSKRGMKQTAGVVYTTDGVNFEASASIPVGPTGVADPRYGAFPSDNVWYVTQGMWPTDDSDEMKESHRLTSRVSIHKRTGKLNINMDAPRKLRDDNSTTGYWGTIAKTEDGGKTWSTVLSTDFKTDYLYFNQIACSSETNCIATAEGTASDGVTPIVVAYLTTDGGKTWAPTLSGTDDTSMCAVKFTSATEGWVVGMLKKGFQMTAQFYKTVDGGKTFTMEQQLSDCFAMDLDFGANVGAATCINSSGSASTVALYK